MSCENLQKETMTTQSSSSSTNQEKSRKSMKDLANLNTSDVADSSKSMDPELVFEKGCKATLSGNCDHVNIEVLGKLEDPKSLYSRESTKEM